MLHQAGACVVIVTACLTLQPQPASLASAKDPVIAAAGDIACNSSIPTPNECHHQHTADILEKYAFDAVLTLGDNQYESGSLSDYQHYYQPTWGRFKSITHPSPGNHEYATPQASGYFAYFGAAAGDPTKGYHSFDLGSWHIVALNSNCEFVGGCHRGSTQELWLRTDLAAHENMCTLAYWHHPRFNSGSVPRSDGEMEAFWRALYEFHADVVLNGHEHNYERFAPQTPDGSADPLNGIRQFVVGTGGRSLRPFGSRTAPNSVVRDSNTFGVLKLVLRPTSYKWRFVPEAGKTFTDSGIGSCTGKTVALKARPRQVHVGKMTHLAATVSPCQGREGDPIRFQLRRNQMWRTVAIMASDMNCTATIDRRVKHTTRFRAVSPADEKSSAGISNQVMVTMKESRPPASIHPKG